MATAGKTKQATTMKRETAVAPLRRSALSKGIVGIASPIYALEFVGTSLPLCTSVMTRQQPQQCLFNDVAMLSDRSCSQPPLNLYISQLHLPLAIGPLHPFLVYGRGTLAHAFYAILYSA